MKLRKLNALRYITPLREGGSLPAIVEADDGELYVMKFVGAGQGRKALIAELIAGELARTLGLNVPELVFLDLDATFAPAEPDPEIRDLLNTSIGLNLGLRFLPEAFTYNPLLQPPPAPSLASRIVWFDAYVTNVDRTPRNVNILLWQKELWLIDHGACLYFHHTWRDYLAHSQTPFPAIKDHTLLPFAAEIAQADAELRPQITQPLIKHIVNLVPDAWLDGETRFADRAAHRRAYADYLSTRLQAAPLFVQEAIHARTTSV